MTISINGVPLDLRVPNTYIEVDNSRAMQGLTQWQKRAIIFGQKTASGTATADIPVLAQGADDADGKFGPGSVLAMACRAFKKANPYTELWACPQSDNVGGAAATGTVTPSGTATENGTFNLLIAGIPVRAAVSNGDTAATIATNIDTALTARDDLPVTSSEASGIITLTAKNKGKLGNEIFVTANWFPGEKYPAGVSCTFPTDNLLSSGDTNPDISTSVANLLDEDWTFFISTYTTVTASGCLDTLKDECVRRWGPTVQVPSVILASRLNSLTNLQAWGSALNSEFISGEGLFKVPEPSWVWAGDRAGVIALYAQSPYYPFRTLKRNVLAPKMGTSTATGRFTDGERNTLLWSGVSTNKIDSADNVRIERSITTYKENAAGAPDASYLDLVTMLKLIEIRFQFRTELMKYARYNTADDNQPVTAGQQILRPKDVKDILIAKAAQMVEVGLMEDLEQFKNALIVEKNASDPTRFDVLLTPNVTNPLYIMAVKLQFIV